MSDFWTWSNHASWEDCIEANRICNLNNCPDTMNCCVSNCVGMPTIKGIVLSISITIIVMFFIWIFNNVRTAEKIVEKKNERR